MLARLPRLRHPWHVLGVFALVIWIVIEAVRLVTMQRAVDRAAYEAARYAVTSAYDKAYCAPPYRLPCNSFDRVKAEAAQDQARLYTIKDIAQLVASPDQPALFETIVCSSRANQSGTEVLYSYREDPIPPSVVPYPRCIRLSDGQLTEDAGGQGDQVIIHVTYKYPLGSFLALNLGTVQLGATYKMINERWSLPRIQGLPPTIVGKKATLPPSLVPTSPWTPTAKSREK